MTLNTDDTLLTSDNHAVMLIDHQYLQLLTVRSHSVETVVNNATFLAEGAKIFNVPTLFTTAFAERQAMFAELQAVHPEQKPSRKARADLAADRAHRRTHLPREQQARCV